MAKSPVIGILVYDIDFDVRDQFGKKFPFFISAAYSKWLECAGAQVVPIWAGRPTEYYKNIMKKINGILFTGGQFYFNDPKFGRAAYSAKTIYEIAIEMNNNGTYFPIWGTCLGFELLFYAASGGETNSRYEGTPVNDNLILTLSSDFEQSKLFAEMDPKILKLLKSSPVTYSSNKFFVDIDILNKFKIANDWKILSTHKNPDNKTYIVITEHAKYPFYGVMFHPEKPQFESYAKQGCLSAEAIMVSQYFASFFIKEAKKNKNSFDTENECCRHLIYNFPITFVQPYVPKIRQCYLFTESTDYPSTPA